jgi:SAM-dependent methyltransferase
VGSCADIPLPDSSIDVVVSFETIEHHDQHERMMEEIKRIMRPKGILLISSPDKNNYSDDPGFSNQYHVKELYEHEFKSLIKNYFNNVVFLGQRVVYGSVILAESSAITTTYWKEDEIIKSSPGLARPLFWVALASDADLPRLTFGIFEQPMEEAEVLRLKDKDLTTVIEQLRQKDEHLATAAELLRQKDEHLATAAELLRQRDEYLTAAAEQLRQKDEYLATAVEQLRQKDEYLAAAAEQLRQKDEYLATAAELLRQKDEHLATAAELIRQRDELLAEANASLAKSVRLP